MDRIYQICQDPAPDLSFPGQLPGPIKAQKQSSFFGTASVFLRDLFGSASVRTEGLPKKTRSKHEANTEKASESLKNGFADSLADIRGRENPI